MDQPLVLGLPVLKAEVPAGLGARGACCPRRVCSLPLQVVSLLLRPPSCRRDHFPRTFGTDNMTLNIDEKYSKDLGRKRMTSREQNHRCYLVVPSGWKLSSSRARWAPSQLTQLSVRSVPSARPSLAVRSSLSCVHSTCDPTVDHKLNRALRPLPGGWAPAQGHRLLHGEGGSTQGTAGCDQCRVTNRR